MSALEQVAVIGRESVCDDWITQWLDGDPTRKRWHARRLVTIRDTQALPADPSIRVIALDGITDAFDASIVRELKRRGFTVEGVDS